VVFCSGFGDSDRASSELLALSPIKSLTGRCLLFLGILLFSCITSAHEVRPALLKLNEVSEGRWQAVFKQPQVQGRFLNLKVKSNCEAGEITQVVGQSALRESFALNCPEALRFIEIEGLDRTMVDTMVTMEKLSGKTSNHLISSRQPTLILGSSVIPAVPVYLVLGIEHLVFGIDHVLFVLVLLYIVSGWANLFKVITSFTVAHSITLALAAFEILSVSQAPVEALIALSILLLVWESLRGEKGIIGSNPWLVAFIFGLLHGLGFAGALAEIGLPQASTVAALFLFNVGIEIGQLGIVTMALLTVYLLHRVSLKFPTRVAALPLYLTGSLATYWFIDRAFQIVA
jgi:HupE / UreJ protein